MNAVRAVSIAVLLGCSGPTPVISAADSDVSDARDAEISASISRAREISVGSHATCSLHVDGSVRCWGNNAQGQLGNGTLTTQARPILVGLPSPAARLSNGMACALDAEGWARCWGPNFSGRLGDGTSAD